jgi:hypothetical protein
LRGSICSRFRRRWTSRFAACSQAAVAEPRGAAMAAIVTHLLAEEGVKVRL